VRAATALCQSVAAHCPAVRAHEDVGQRAPAECAGAHAVDDAAVVGCPQVRTRSRVTCGAAADIGQEHNAADAPTLIACVGIGHCARLRSPEWSHSAAEFHRARVSLGLCLGTFGTGRRVGPNDDLGLVIGPARG
jgi:hypothetical protein